MRRGIAIGALVALVAVVAVPAFGTTAAKNIIVLISDGAGYNAWDLSSYYEYGALGNQPYDDPVGAYDWKKYACTTYMLNAATGLPTPKADPGDPTDIRPGYHTKDAFSDYDAVVDEGYGVDYTGSASAATAWMTGVKTDRGSINMDYNDNPLTTIGEIAKSYGKKVGTVSSVQFSHATPACVWAHNVSRNNYAEVANEMIYSSGLDLIMGCGNPDYTADGVHSPGSGNTKYVGGAAAWTDITDDGMTTSGFTAVHSKADFEALADGTYNGGVLPAKVLGIPEVYQTLQSDRSANGAGGGFGNPSGDAFNANVPSLETMTEAAMRLLDNSEGFFLQVEGGAIDWTNHGGAGERMIEEQIDFNNTVQAVIDWVGANSSWEETLLLVTADHECGHLWGPDSAADNAFNPLVNNGVGNVPDHEYGLYWDGSQWVRYGSHSNALVPLWALGCGSELFADYVGAVDPDGQFMNGTDDVYGPYIDNTNMFDVMNTVAPEPATLGILAAGTVGLLIRRRRRRC